MEQVKIYDKEGPIDSIKEATGVTVGVFDGVHRGHRELLAELKTKCDGGCAPLVVSLTRHPSFVLGRRASEYWLDDPEEHLRMLFEAGAKYVVEMPFTREVAGMTACELTRWMYEKLQMRYLLLGYDSRFGSKEKDDFGQLPQLAAKLGFTLERGLPYTVTGEPISSSRIRRTLEDGAVEETAALLGRPFCLTGTVTHGRGVGRTLGFPTANIDLAQTRKMLPKEGVYAVRIGDCKGMANLGDAPTFGMDKSLLEVHLIDYQGDLYGKTVTAEFLHRIRDIRRFGSAGELQAQLNKDIEEARQW